MYTITCCCGLERQELQHTYNVVTLLRDTPSTHIFKRRLQNCRDLSMSTQQSQWLFYAISSGACAALNGVFAKLTTTHLTSSWATWLSHFFGMKDESMVIEGLVRGVCI
jgi:hypothetical protein